MSERLEQCLLSRPFFNVISKILCFHLDLEYEYVIVGSRGSSVSLGHVLGDRSYIPGNEVLADAAEKLRKEVTGFVAYSPVIWLHN